LSIFENTVNENLAYAFRGWLGGESEVTTLAFFVQMSLILPDQ